ncbi:transcription termination factor 1-like [Acanthaster planci]|uniref:Transcription termination factor 1-like n=1 Tax=Acanthaster planci TaxID=133434 RepID=A0A8B7ZRI8_ACAPL|nr:transcription termination factor 1-like [Acanthaster planci]
MLVTQSKEDDVMDKLVGIPWRKVCKMVPTRNIHQCRNHWKDKLCWSVGNRTRRRWTDAESADLIKSVYNLDVNEESDIDWVKLHKEFWERAPSPSKLSQMWYILKLRHLDNYHFMTFEEILDQLYHKVLPVLKGRLKKQEAAKAKMKSKESISSSEDDSSSEEDDDWY